jgi:HAD superfamily hydrolase (TIGR01509 family)
MPGVFSSKKNLLFDLDGTLIDSEPAHAHAYLATLEKYAPALVATFDYAALAGQPSPQALASLGFSGATLEAAVVHKQRHYREALAAGDVLLFPHVHEVLTRLRASGRRLFLVTGASGVAVSTILKHHHLTGFFVGVVVGEDAARGKPHPDPYLLALENFALQAADSLAIEDGLNGARSALAAGLACVLVRTSLVLPGTHSLADFALLPELWARE